MIVSNSRMRYHSQTKKIKQKHDIILKKMKEQQKLMERSRKQMVKERRQTEKLLRGMQTRKSRSTKK
jgi:hypothetical protein